MCGTSLVGANIIRVHLYVKRSGLMGVRGRRCVCFMIIINQFYKQLPTRRPTWMMMMMNRLRYRCGRGLWFVGSVRK